MRSMTFTRTGGRRHWMLGLMCLCLLSACSLDVSHAEPRPSAPRPTASPPSAEDDRPTAAGGFDVESARFWAWDRPRGKAAGLPQIIEMVRLQVHFLDGGPAADRVCNMILQRGLGVGEVCILLQGFGEAGGDPRGKRYHVTGQTPLFLHWDDGLARGAASNWWYTPWMRNGIEQSGDWMRDFIARYKTRQLQDDRIPDPFRFHFDSEGGVRVTQTPLGALESFHAMRSDPRWNTERLPGFNRTVADLYEEAGQPSYDRRTAWYKPPNRTWSIWYHGICIEACDGAMNTVAYEPIRAAWPTCRSSNYRTATSFDGIDGRYDVDGLNPWLKTVHRSYADMQAPICYRTVTAPSPKRPILNAQNTLQVFQGRVANMAVSHGHRDPALVVPWLELVGNIRTVQGQKLVQTPEESFLEIMALGDLGVREFIIWSNPSSGTDADNWNALADIVRGVPPTATEGSSRR